MTHPSFLRHTLFSLLMPVLFLLFFSEARARPLVADLSLRSIPINSSFKGIEILLFGARNDAGDIVVVIRGPKINYLVRKKERVAGIWVNRKQVNFDGVDGFYTVAANRPLDEIHNDLLLSVLNIGLQNETFSGKSSEAEQAIIPEFQDALLNEKIKKNLYITEIKEVSFIGDTLFRTIIRFPDNIPRGVYTAEVYLFSDGQLVGMQSTPLQVYKTGFDALVYDFAYRYDAFYGILAVLIALGAGWGAGAIFKKV